MVTVVTSRLSDISMEMAINLIMSVIDADTGDEISNAPLIQCGGYLMEISAHTPPPNQFYLVDERSIIQLDCPTTPPTGTAGTGPHPLGGAAATIFMPASIIYNLTTAAVIVLLAVM